MIDKLIKQDFDWDCRAISEKFLNKFKKDYIGKTRRTSDISFYPFIELVKAHDELAFCFRGNGDPERVIIYMNNHSVFTITSATLYINPHYFRFCEDWENRLGRWDVVIMYVLSLDRMDSSLNGIEYMIVKSNELT